MGIVPTPESDRRRFWIKVEKTPVCWLWTAARFDNGYGAFRLGNKQRRAHIVSYEWLVGPTNGLQVCHSCDVRHCVRPGHLFLGTQSDNIIDMFQKGRQRDRRGEISNWAKLTENEVREIHALASAGAPQAAVAEQYGITQTAVSHIVLGKTWTHLGLVFQLTVGKPRLTAEAVHTVRHAYLAGVSVPEIVRQTGVTRASVYRIGNREAYGEIPDCHLCNS